MPTFSSAADVFIWLARFINVETGQTSTSLSLDNIKLLAEIAGHPEKSAPVIHIAGSKGKGSVTGMITAMLAAEGFRPARYTSPHVIEYRERITLGNEFFEDAVYINAGMELVSIEEELEKRFGKEGSFFELLTLYFFLCAKRARTDVMVLETGLGGRLDATNIVDPLVSVITIIELEHTEFLGTTIPAVAGEKAGIIKEGRPLILAEQSAEALAVFRNTAAAKNAPLVYFPETAEIRDVLVDKNGTRFSLGSRKGAFPPLELSIPIPGEIQTLNAGLAVLAARTAFPSLSTEAIVRGLRDFGLPARFERLFEEPEVIIDGAHTPNSVEACVKTFVSLYGRGGILLFGCAANKDAASMARLLIPYFSRIIITTPGTFKLSFPEQVYEVFRQENGACSATELSFIKDTTAAIQEVLALAKEVSIPVLATGSFYLAAELRKLVSNAGGVV
jgi:dihydrofolate synthase/folylpolyglutamate synthase